MWVPDAAEIDVLIEFPVTAAVLVLVSSEYPMEVTGCDEHVDALAVRLNGEPTAEAFAGLLTVIPEAVPPDELGDEVVDAEVLEADPPHPVPTRMSAISNEQEIMVFLRNITS